MPVEYGKHYVNLYNLRVPGLAAGIDRAEVYRLRLDFVRAVAASSVESWLQVDIDELRSVRDLNVRALGEQRHADPGAAADRGRMFGSGGSLSLSRPRLLSWVVRPTAATGFPLRGRVGRSSPPALPLKATGEGLPARVFLDLPARPRRRVTTRGVERGRGRHSPDL